MPPSRKPEPRKARPKGPYGIEPRPRRKRKKGAARPRAVKRRGLDAYRLLSAVMGAFCGLVLYSVVTPGYMPDESPPKLVGSRVDDLALMRIEGRRGSDGLYHVKGQIFNKVDQPCRYASLSIRFFDQAGELVTKRSATAENIQAGALQPFQTEAFVPNAVRYEVAVDLAHF